MKLLIKEDNRVRLSTIQVGGLFTTNERDLLLKARDTYSNGNHRMYKVCSGDTFFGNDSFFSNPLVWPITISGEY